MNFLRHSRWLAGIVAVGAAALALRSSKAKAADEDLTEVHERCALRLSIAMYGESPSAEMMSGDPQTKIDEMIASPKFIERFARFTNSQFNNGPGMTAAQDVTYYLAKYVLEKGEPWKQLFVGPYDVAVAEGDKSGIPRVTPKADGLGYFRTDAWMRRYAGNEPAGIRLSAAYHILNNVTGLELVASTNAPEADVSATGRQAEACRGCHFESWYGLDRVAKVLSLKVTKADVVSFQPQANGPQPLLDTQVSDDKQLLETLVASDSFKFRTCRLAFQFLYGRVENKCEAQLFDRCMTNFAQTGAVQSAIATVAKDGSFCQ